MSSYTMPLSLFVEVYYQDVLVKPPLREQIEFARTKLFDFDYPIFDENYKRTLETNFINHFFMREIGFETEGLFKFRLETWMLINMPYFNQMFKSELIKFDPLINEISSVDHKRNHDSMTVSDRGLTTTDRRTIDKDGNVNLSRDDTTDKTQNVTGDATLRNDVESTVNESDHQTNVISNEGVTDSASTNDTTSKQKTTDKTKEESFDRNLVSDTPDSRLNITTQDGKGVIEYASRITEDTEKDTKDVENNVDRTDKIKTDGTVNTMDTSNGEIDSTKDTVGSETTNQTNNTNENLKSNEGFHSKSNTTNNENTVDTFNGHQKDSGSSSVVGLDNYLQKRVGKIGTVTQSEMLTEFRKTFVRIEKEMFDEMNELFMLVY